MMSIFECLQLIFSLEYGIEPSAIAMDKRLRDDLGMDSLDLVTLVMIVEEEFGIEMIPDEEAEKLTSVGDVVQYIQTNQTVTE